MRFEVIAATEEDYAKALPKPECPVTEYSSFYEDLLLKAAREGIHQLDLQGVGLRSKPSENFQYMGMAEQSIMRFLREHGLPEKVRMLCVNDEELKQHMVVYNFYFAGEKSTRQNDGRWD